MQIERKNRSKLAEKAAEIALILHKFHAQGEAARRSALDVDFATRAALDAQMKGDNSKQLCCIETSFFWGQTAKKHHFLIHLNSIYHFHVHFSFAFCYYFLLATRIYYYCFPVYMYLYLYSIFFALILALYR